MVGNVKKIFVIHLCTLYIRGGGVNLTFHTPSGPLHTIFIIRFHLLVLVQSGSWCLRAIRILKGNENLKFGILFLNEWNIVNVHNSQSYFSIFSKTIKERYWLKCIVLFGLVSYAIYLIFKDGTSWRSLLHFMTGWFIDTL